MMVTEINTPPTCSIDGCNKPHHGKGWCEAHYRRWERTGAPGAADIRPWGQGACSIDDCERKVHARTMCGTHYRRWERSNASAQLGA